MGPLNIEHGFSWHQQLLSGEVNDTSVIYGFLQSWKINGVCVCPGPIPAFLIRPRFQPHTDAPPTLLANQTGELSKGLPSPCLPGWLSAAGSLALLDIQNCPFTHPTEPLVQPLTPLLIFLSTPLSPGSRSPWEISTSVFPG